MSGNLRTLTEVEGELRLVERFLARLKKSFQLEKEAALSENAKALWLLRERSRTHYQPSTFRLQSYLKQLRYRMIKVERIPSGIFLRLEALEKAIKETQAHFAGTPNRLLRSAGENTGDD